jgi:hypothetical protein
LNEDCERLHGQLKELEEPRSRLQGCWCHIQAGP